MSASERPTVSVLICTKDRRDDVVNVGKRPNGLAIGGGSVWVANGGERIAGNVRSSIRPCARDAAGVGVGFLYCLGCTADHMESLLPQILTEKLEDEL